MAPTTFLCVVTVLGLLLSGAHSTEYNLRMLPDEKAKATNAVCLDGTNPGYYIRPGKQARNAHQHTHTQSAVSRGDDIA